jgi:hypothetical protein
MTLYRNKNKRITGEFGEEQGNKYFYKKVVPAFREFCQLLPDELILCEDREMIGLIAVLNLLGIKTISASTADNELLPFVCTMPFIRIEIKTLEDFDRINILLCEVPPGILPLYFHNQYYVSTIENIKDVRGIHIDIDADSEKIIELGAHIFNEALRVHYLDLKYPWWKPANLVLMAERFERMHLISA